MKTRKPTSGLYAETHSDNGHGSWQSLSAWVSAQPGPTCHCLSSLSLPLSSSSSPSLPPHSPLPISLSSHSSSFGSYAPPHLSIPQPPPPPAPTSLSKDLQATVPSLHPPSSPSPFSLRGCSSRCTLTALGYCVWKCSCWTRRPLQSSGQRVAHLCLRLVTFDLQTHTSDLSLGLISLPAGCSHFKKVFE